MKTFAPNQLDFYKVLHREQYPEGTEYVYSNLTARSGKHSNIEGSEGVVFIGLQMFIIDVLINEWNDTFFSQDKDTVISKYRTRMQVALNRVIDTKPLEALHDLGYLPIKIKALPEGSFVPYGVPMMTIVNTKPEFFWVTNMLESVISTELWQVINSATTYTAYSDRFNDYADITCENRDHVPFQGHDFSFRGMACRQAAAKSAFAVLACGSLGTDTVTALDVAEEFYGASPNEFIAGSIPATEHSVMCAGSKDGELETFERLLFDVYPTGMLSVVSDTWDLWKVVDEFLPRLKERLMQRDGKLVIRPDSGDPVEIICGSIQRSDYPNLILNYMSSEEKGLIESLWDIFGGTVNKKGYKVLHPCIGAIYGESITLERQEAILGLLERKGFASSNIVLGIGSHSFQYTTRDTHGMAIKATNVTINGIDRAIFKAPATDNGLKKSAKGLLHVGLVDSKYVLTQNVSKEEEVKGELVTVFCDGQLLHKVTLNDIRCRVSNG